MKKYAIDEFTHVATLAALQANAILKTGFGTIFQTTTKTGLHDLVTDYDYRSEEVIIKTIQKHFPQHEIVSEESNQKVVPGKELYWIIDPLDGTLNFAHNIPLFAVSIAVSTATTPLCSVITFPLSGDLYIAQKGKGAFYNGKKLEVSMTTSLNKSFLSLGLSHHAKEEEMSSLLSFLKRIGKIKIPIRRTGSSVTDLMHVAAGRLDGYFETELMPWDFAGAKLFIEEAGGTITTKSNRTLSPLKKSSVIAGNPHIHKALYELYKKSTQS